MEDLVSKIWDEFRESKLYHNMENLEDVFGNILKFDIDYEEYSFIVKLVTSKKVVVFYKTCKDKNYFENCEVFSCDWSIHINNLRHIFYLQHVPDFSIREVLNLDKEKELSESVISLDLDDPRRSLKYIDAKFYGIKMRCGLEDQMQSLFGSILKSEITGYYKYFFEITLTTEIGVLIIYRTNGIPEEIYNFCPTSTFWLSHERKLEKSDFVDFEEM